MVRVYGGVMALTGDRTPRHPHWVAIGVVRVLLAAAVVLVPALQCPPAAPDTAITAPVRHVPATAGVHGAAAQLGALIAVAGDGDHHRCALLTAATTVVAAAADAVHGWGTVPAAAMFLVATAAMLWSHSTRGPPRRAAIWFLRRGRDRLQHFCVMRR
ncbi:hypothetical protein [Mycobacteroides franklinii]|uniref:hypothetical protein n=2 Tax=Mycobacteriaceae TaxID=1762 RepID=UPI0009CD7DF9|nr:hypothetical protein [Mycobacteroides franklinii]SKL50925.1 Uncharacterised protein [Mycobacteroides abscessus subsp. bolletii]